MSEASKKSTNKAATASVVGVGVAVGVAALQSASAKSSSEMATTSQTTASAAVLPAAVNPNAVEQEAVLDAPASVTNIEQMVDAYLGADNSEQLSLEALTESELQDHLPEPELLNALADQPGLLAAGPAPFPQGTAGSLGGVSLGGIIGGALLGGLALNEIAGNDNTQGSV
jgi:hypothetical protein